MEVGKGSVVSVKEVGGLWTSFSQSGCQGCLSVEPHLRVLYAHEGMGISLRGCSPQAEYGSAMSRSRGYSQCQL